MHHDVVRDALVGAPDRGRGTDLVDMEPITRMVLGAGGFGRHFFAGTAFAWAFICFLYARTFSREARSVMSATESKDPRLPKSPAASRHPRGVTPYCLPSSATKIAD